MASISSLSLQYVKVPIFGTEEGLPVDPTSSTVTMAFTAVGSEPTSGDWQTASWETDATRDPDRYYARCLVGPSGTITLEDGTYWVWWKIAGPDPEVPVGRAKDALTVT